MFSGLFGWCTSLTAFSFSREKLSVGGANPYTRHALPWLLLSPVWRLGDHWEVPWTWHPAPKVVPTFISVHSSEYNSYELSSKEVLWFYQQLPLSFFAYRLSLMDSFIWIFTLSSEFFSPQRSFSNYNTQLNLEQASPAPGTNCQAPPKAGPGHRTLPLLRSPLRATHVTCSPAKVNHVSS